MLHSLDEQGNLTWNCPHNPEDAGTCGVQNSAHISHEQVEWIGTPDIPLQHHSIALPFCSGCGARTFLKVSFTEQELKAPNMWQAWNEAHDAHVQVLQDQHEQAEEGTPQKDMLSGQLAALRAAKEAGGYHLQSHTVAQRHMELASQLLASGKHPPTESS